MNLRYTPQAILDLEQIRDYISYNLQNPDAAKNTIRTIAGKAASLKDMPYLGVELRRKIGRDVEGRALIVGRYMVIYDVAEEISILRVLDTRVDYLRMIGTW